MFVRSVQVCLELSNSRQSLSCLSAVSLCCLSAVSPLSLSCLSAVSQLSLSCLSAVSQQSLNSLSAVFQKSLSSLSAVSQQSCSSPAAVLQQSCSSLAAVLQQSCSSLAAVSLKSLGSVSTVSQHSLSCLLLSASSFTSLFSEYTSSNRRSTKYFVLFKQDQQITKTYIKVISGPAELKTLTDAVGCGKRNTRENKESTLAECLWNCEVNKIRKIFI